MPVIDPLVIALVVGSLGGAFSAFLGWLNGEEVFNSRKFANGVIRAALGGAGLVLTLGVPTARLDYVILFFASLGIDVAAYDTYKAAKNVNAARKVVPTS